jgi:carbamoylphosphate synthase small subunit
MTGYQEVSPIPSYFGQVLIMTSDHIGNYGVKQDEVEYIFYQDSRDDLQKIFR